MAKFVETQKFCQQRLNRLIPHQSSHSLPEKKLEVPIQSTERCRQLFLENPKNCLNHGLFEGSVMGTL